mgnify:CR=1 FL=1
MAEMISVTGYSPEQLRDAVDLVVDCDVSAVIFRGMAGGVHDQLERLYADKYIFGAINKFPYPGEVSSALKGLGFDLGYFSRQTLDAEVWPLDTLQSTTIELVQKGQGINWHTDVVKTDKTDEIYLPYGVGFSLNLAGSAIFRVTKERAPLSIPASKLSRTQLDVLITEASIEHTGEAVVLEGYLEPGDVVCWRQPVAHQVSVLDQGRHAIVFIQEDHVTAVE